MSMTSDAIMPPIEDNHAEADLVQEPAPPPISSGKMSVDLLRELFRNLLAWRSLFTAEGVDTLTCPDGQVISLWDLEFLYAVSQQILPVRQRQAIRRCLLLNYSEQDAAATMNIDATNPVAMYATSGLERIVHMLKFDLLPSRSSVFAEVNRKKSFQDFQAKTAKRRSLTVTTTIFLPSNVFEPSKSLYMEF